MIVSWFPLLFKCVALLVFLGVASATSVKSLGAKWALVVLVLINCIMLMSFSFGSETRESEFADVLIILHKIAAPASMLFTLGIVVLMIYFSKHAQAGDAVVGDSSSQTAAAEANASDAGEAVSPDERGAANLFLKRRDKIYGPWDMEKIGRLKKAGKLSPGDLIGRSKEGPWQPVNEFFSDNG